MVRVLRLFLVITVFRCILMLVLRSFLIFSIVLTWVSGVLVIVFDVVGLGLCSDMKVLFSLVFCSV